MPRKGSGWLRDHSARTVHMREPALVSGNTDDLFHSGSKWSSANAQVYPTWCEYGYIWIPSSIRSKDSGHFQCFLKPSAHSRFLSLRHAIVGFSSCRTQQIFIVDRYKVWSAPPWNILQALRRNDIARQIRMSTLYLCISIGLVSHVFYDFCRDTPHTADFCFWSLAIKNKYQTCLNSKLSLLR